MLVSSIFFSSHNVFYPTKHRNDYFSKIQFAVCKCFELASVQPLVDLLKVALQILGRKFYKNTEKSPLYSQRILIFIHKTPVVENHQKTRAIRELLLPRSTTKGIAVYFYTSSSLYLHTGNI